MASFAEMIFAQAADQTDPSKTTAADNFVKGASLALERERMQQGKQQLEQKKEELQLAKLEKVGGWFEVASKMEDGPAKKAFVSKFIPNGINALGVNDAFHPVSLEMLQGNPLVVKYAVNEIRQGRLDPSKLYGAMANPDQAALLYNSPGFKQFGGQEEIQSALQESIGQLAKAGEFAASEEGKFARAQLMGQQQANRIAATTESAGPKALAAKLADKFADYEAGGGKAGMQSSLEKLESAANALETGTVVTGGASTKLPGFNSEDAQSVLNPQMVAVKQEAQGALNTVLRQTLGAQFTEKEGERVLNQIWDDRQPPKVNAKKIRSKIKELRSGIISSERQYIKQGFMRPEDSLAGSSKAAGGKRYELNGKTFTREKLEQFLKDHPGDVDAPKVRKLLGVK